MGVSYAGFATKAYKAVARRPFEFLGNARAYLLFRITRFLSQFLFPFRRGLELGQNVRVQRLSCLSAERPNAAVEIGAHSIIYENAKIAAYGNGHISIGERAVIGDVRIYCREKISIGKRSIFSWNVFIQDFHPHPINPEARGKQLVAITEGFLPVYDGHEAHHTEPTWNFPSDPVELGDDIWFGANSTILPGSKIGSGSIVAAGAVVVKGSYPPRSILAGNPARIVKEIP